MKKAKFKIIRFNNRNGVVSWRVDGRLNGGRVRKNFKTREEASAEKAVFELNAIRATSGLRSAVTCLVDEQLREAEALFWHPARYAAKLYPFLAPVRPAEPGLPSARDGQLASDASA